MKTKLIADCSANICSHITKDISYVPLKIITDDKEYSDTPELDVPQMLKELKAYKGRSGTGCPGVQEWLDAFDDSDIIYGVSLTSNLSGCYNSAQAAVLAYLEQKPDAKVYIHDSLSTGPELELLLEKYESLIDEGLGFDEVCDGIKDYSTHTHLIFSLESLDNFAKNGRVSPIVAKAAGMLGLRIVGKASDEGTLEPMHKCKGEKKAISTLFDMLREMGYRGGKVRISHSYNEGAAIAFANKVREEFPDCDLSINLNRGLCCYYAEEGAVLIGFEDM